MTTSTTPYTGSELLTVMSARLLRDGQVVFAGVGIPLLAATLAQRLHGPGLTILFEGGTIGAPAAIANALADALGPLGADVFELPMTPERLFRLLRKKRQVSGS